MSVDTLGRRQSINRSGGIDPRDWRATPDVPERNLPAWGHVTVGDIAWVIATGECVAVMGETPDGDHWVIRPRFRPDRVARKDTIGALDGAAVCIGGRIGQWAAHAKSATTWRDTHGRVRGEWLRQAARHDAWVAVAGMVDAAEKSSLIDDCFELFDGIFSDSGIDEFFLEDTTAQAIRTQIAWLRATDTSEWTRTQFDRVYLPNLNLRQFDSAAVYRQLPPLDIAVALSDSYVHPGFRVAKAVEAALEEFWEALDQAAVRYSWCDAYEAAARAIGNRQLICAPTNCRLRQWTAIELITYDVEVEFDAESLEIEGGVCVDPVTATVKVVLEVSHEIAASSLDAAEAKLRNLYYEASRGEVWEALANSDYHAQLEGTDFHKLEVVRIVTYRAVDWETLVVELND